MYKNMLKITFRRASTWESHMFSTFPVATDPYQEQILRVQRSSKWCSKADISSTKLFGERKSARRTLTSRVLNAERLIGGIEEFQMSFVSINNLGFNHQPLVFDTVVLCGYVLKLGSFGRRKKKHVTLSTAGWKCPKIHVQRGAWKCTSSYKWIHNYIILYAYI